MSEIPVQEIKIPEDSNGNFAWCIVNGYITIEGLFNPLTNTIHIKFKTPIFYKEFELTLLKAPKKKNNISFSLSEFDDYFIVSASPTKKL